MKIALYGYGKMGRAIEEVATARGHDVVLRVDADNAGTPPVGADVAIEFTRPEQAVDNMRLCLAHGVPVVVGTTGWYDRLGEVREMVGRHRTALLWASNFSIGVNLFFRLNRHLARLMDGQPAYDVAIHEVHHAHKRDAPSGTAITLARDIDLVAQRYAGWDLVGQEAVNADPDAPRAIPIRAERTGEVPGTHSVTWATAEDRITITHEAFGRRGFATGAVIAAEWVQGRSGLFTMADVLGG
ncbi:MAG: 4-hydroxy-tetrahydrodipicolinate reductase [Flavobacteriales bacterium]|jgi:4-hydroxy-tetrahydrodipicolinate reductase|nr:4-hydroxy-tetrahydrodipicolinate reductase [Flavobacteriales bacterium]